MYNIQGRLGPFRMFASSLSQWLVGLVLIIRPSDAGQVVGQVITWWFHSKGHKLTKLTGTTCQLLTWLPFTGKISSTPGF